MEYWNVEDMTVGDTIKVMVVNKKGDKNLDGCILSGRIKDLKPEYDMVRLESGWCCHTKDRLLEHTQASRKYCYLYADEVCLFG